jgi:hypothetical protein
MSLVLLGILVVSRPVAVGRRRGREALELDRLQRPNR